MLPPCRPPTTPVAHDTGRMPQTPPTRFPMRECAGVTESKRLYVRLSLRGMDRDPSCVRETVHTTSATKPHPETQGTTAPSHTRHRATACSLRRVFLPCVPSLLRAGNTLHVLPVRERCSSAMLAFPLSVSAAVWTASRHHRCVAARVVP